MRERTPNVLVFLCTYPKCPSWCETEKLGEVPYVPERFKTKEGIFIETAKHFGLPTGNRMYREKTETYKGRTVDLSCLILPRHDGSYYKVGFYS